MADTSEQHPIRRTAGLTARLATQTDAIYFFFAVFFLAPALAAVFFAMRRLLGWQGRFNPSRD